MTMKNLHISEQEPDLYLEVQHLASENPMFRHYTDLVQEHYNTTLRKMSHEINNSLTLIHSSLQLIESSHSEVKDYKFWTSTMEDVDYLIHLMSEITVFNHSSTIHEDVCEIAQLLKSIINGFTACHPEIQYNLIINQKIPEIKGDSVKLRQVFTNIIKNSIEALDCVNSPSINIILTFDTKKNLLELNFEDNGAGISKSAISTIFRPMVTYKKNGTGLGLAISKRIIESHQGDIAVNSELSKGTTITIHLPA